MGNKIPLIFPAVMAGGAAVPWYLAGGIPAANCVAAYKAIGAADLAASYVNLANPGTYDLTAPTAAPTWDTTLGWIFNGSTQYLATGITPGDARTWSILIRFDNVTADTGYMCGYYNLPTAGFGWIITPRRGGDNRKYYSGNTVLDVNDLSRSGVIGIAGNTAYYNSASDGTITTAASSGEIYLGADKSNAGTPPIHAYLAGRIQAVAIYDTALTLAQVGAVTAAMSFF